MLFEALKVSSPVLLLPWGINQELLMWWEKSSSKESAGAAVPA